MNPTNPDTSVRHAFHMMEAALGVIPGHPVLTFFNAKHDVLINICPIPMTGLDPQCGLSFTYPIQVIATKGLPSATIAQMCHDALDRFDMAALISCSVQTPEEKAEDIIRIKLFVDPSPDERDGSLSWSVMASVEVTQEAMDKHTTLTRKQLEVSQRLMDINFIGVLGAAGDDTVMKH